MNIKALMLRTRVPILFILVLVGVIVASLFVYNMQNKANGSIDTSEAVRNTHWGDNVTITMGDGNFRYQSDSIPNHVLNEEYVMPDNFTPCVPHPTPDCTHIEPVAESILPVRIDITITTKPEKVEETISSAFGGMGVMISGSPVYNPFEGDGVTVAMNANFTLTNALGELIPFMDACHGHPAPHPRPQYHYHGLSLCVTSQVEDPQVAEQMKLSQIIGYAYDGFPIYGDKDINGNPIDPTTLDECNGIDSPTVEFPDGIYHYVLLNVPTVQSTVRCLHGKLEFPLVTYQWQLP